MGAITGEEYIRRINRLNPNVWFEGKRIQGELSSHRAFKGVMKSQAKLYDMQHKKSLRDKMTFRSPITGDRVGMSYLIPETKEDLMKRRNMIQEWAGTTAGMMGRSPDYMNTVLTALASSAEQLKGEKNCFPTHLQSFYEMAREKDLCFTHTFINPQVNRSQFYLGAEEEVIAARVVEQNEEGLVIKGARLLATQGGMTDELLVFSAAGCLDPDQAFAFSIPSHTPGLTFMCRESFAYKDSSFDYPLSSRFEEMDTVVVFDHVLVPWERVFFYNNVEIANSFFKTSAFLPMALHQVVCRQTVKTEFILGVAQMMVDTIQIGEYQHVQEKISEIIVALEMMKSFLSRSEMEAEKDQWGVMRPALYPLLAAINTFPRQYPRFSEILQQLGASGLMLIPSEKDFESKMKKNLDQYLQGATRDARERVKLFRLAWDMCMSSFGSRQTLYEQFFFGDPVRLASVLYNTYERDEYVKRVEKFLNREE
ncbi:4-hydroxyphenylacetate 3-monooxygenase [Melghiribacillus thermohalophilus]|uniref:4-hydroxyphenylacetate 3-monooxygenase n=1 Tax=Melghiribacillus thermohalophilus TaxID=1324956 RepID=A0A4R3MQW7_9BACI|nr:4-hydroxyphenylacetate 3-monooxygenase, oxygenase component [Melghiribacillus thermohalophilus]TCT17540.1 4-hydroxyphenylacetate 3-monooxygenase [Melghiribacillus thermohalophilus]